MRTILLTIALATLVWATPAQACLTASFETHVFLPAVPQEVPEDAVVLRVEGQGDIDWSSSGTEVRVVDVIRSEWEEPVAWIAYGAFTSCSRANLPADGAYVVGMRSTVAPNTLNVRQYRMSELEGTHDAQ